MLKPSYAELMDILNNEAEDKDVITSRYTIVIAAAKRARQIISGDEPMTKGKEGKPLSTAVEELAQSKIKIVPEGQGTVLHLKESIMDNGFEFGNLRNNDTEQIFDSTTVGSSKERTDVKDKEVEVQEEITETKKSLLKNDDLILEELEDQEND